MPFIGQSQGVDELLMKLKNKLELELSFQEKAFELLGTLDTLFAAASTSNVSITDTASDTVR